jgi:hypothetical protein
MFPLGGQYRGEHREWRSRLNQNQDTASRCSIRCHSRSTNDDENFNFNFSILVRQKSWGPSCGSDVDLVYDTRVKFLAMTKRLSNSFLTRAVLHGGCIIFEIGSQERCVVSVVGRWVRCVANTCSLSLLISCRLGRSYHFDVDDVVWRHNHQSQSIYKFDSTASLSLR